MSIFVKYIQESFKRMKQHSINGTPIVVKDDFIGDIDLDFVSREMSSMIPFHLMDGLDIIYVGSFEELEEKEVNAIYLNGAIYVTNLQSSEEDLINDLVHEIAHFVEEKYTEKVYGDSMIEREFYRKRNIMADLLQRRGYDVPHKFRVSPEYNQGIDDFLYKFVGYPKLRDMITNLFISPYSITDIREYFAISFENYILGDKNEVRETTPSVYIVLEDIIGNN